MVRDSRCASSCELPSVASPRPKRLASLRLNTWPIRKRGAGEGRRGPERKRRRILLLVWAVSISF